MNSVGVKYCDLRGTISKNPLYSGLHFKVPFVDKIISISTELWTADVDGVQVTTRDARRVIVDIELQKSMLLRQLPWKITANDTYPVRG